MITEDLKEMVISEIKNRIKLIAQKSKLDESAIRVKAYLESLKEKPVFALFNGGKFVRALSMKELAKSGAMDMLYRLKARHIKKIIRAYFETSMNALSIQDAKKISLSLYLTEDNRQEPVIGLFIENKAKEAILLRKFLDEAEKQKGAIPNSPL